MRAVFVAFALLLSLLPLRAADDSDKAAIRTLIERQIDAFRRDDAAGAYGFAAPLIRRSFPDEAAFLGMVRELYRPVYRPRDVSFGEFKETELGPTQVVRLSDQDGETWLAVYTLEKQPDGRWLISGCFLVKDKSERA
jgi:uncharacterized protein DUF4864